MLELRSREMVPSSVLFKKLARLSGRYLQLLERFEAFAKHVETQTQEPSFLVKDISTSLHLSDRYFTVTFAGRTVRFEFSTPVGDNGTFRGLIRCYLLPSFPETAPVELSSFTFKGSGQTELKEPEVNITYDLQALYLALHTIYEALDK